tara:strand:- start:123 stop:386 length:264 start_codon:yes stop_codon:yes gene_type:complete
MIKALLFLSIFLTLIPINSLSKERICKIKYKEKNLSKRIMHRQIIKDKNNKFPVICTLIGFEYDKNKLPEKNKPIFACCQKIRKKAP